MTVRTVRTVAKDFRGMGSTGEMNRRGVDLKTAVEGLNLKTAVEGLKKLKG
jgi:hypothetical protein